MNPGQASTFAPALQFLEVASALALVLVVAWLVLKFGLSRLSGFKAPSGGAIEMVARYPLEPRKTLYIVRAGAEMMLIGTSESQVHFLAGLSPANADAIRESVAPAVRAGFSSVLGGLRKKDVRP